jgi:hypothetical protein
MLLECFSSEVSDKEYRENPRSQAVPGNVYLEALPRICLLRFRRGRASRHAFLGRA